MNSGLAVTSSSSRSCGTRSTMAVSSSSEVGSIQWTSSKITKTGAGRLPLELSRQRRQCLFLAFLRAQLMQPVVIPAGNATKAGQHRDVLRVRRGLGDQRVELGQFLRRRIAALEPGGAFELADEREERAVGVMRRAEIAQRDVRFAPQPFVERERDVRLADARFARQHHHATFPLRGMPPPA